MNKMTEGQLKVNELAAVADLIPRHAEHQALDDALRRRVAADVSALQLSSLRPYVGSLERDPFYASNWYLAVDAVAGGVATPLLLEIAPASTPAGDRFHDPILTQRIRTESGSEILCRLAVHMEREDTDGARLEVPARFLHTVRSDLADE